jgi:hypothetical protein
LAHQPETLVCSVEQAKNVVVVDDTLVGDVVLCTESTVEALVIMVS